MAKPVNPANLNGVGDNTQLMHLHEPSLLYNIRFRYAKNLIYTYTGAGPAARTATRTGAHPQGHRGHDAADARLAASGRA